MLSLRPRHKYQDSLKDILEPYGIFRKFHDIWKYLGFSFLKLYDAVVPRGFQSFFLCELSSSAVSSLNDMSYKCITGLFYSSRLLHFKVIAPALARMMSKAIKFSIISSHLAFS